MVDAGADMVASGAPDWLVSVRVPAVLTDAPDLPACGEGLVAADIRIEKGSIAAIEAPRAREGAVLDGRDGMVWPAFVDMHTHLDKGHIWPREPNPDGSFAGAIESVAVDSTAHWSAEDVHTRADFALRSAYAHGTSAIRTHLDSMPPQDEISWPVFEALRAEWTGRIALQGVCLFTIERARDGEYLAGIADRVAAAGGILGAVTFMTPDLPALLDAVFDAAAARGLDLDFHVDESLDPAANSLEIIADTALAKRFAGRIVAGHCCSLSVQGEAEIARLLGKLREAGIGVVSLPMCNLYLQDRRPGATPRRRGVTLIHEMQAAGIPVAIASDNVRDPFYAYGDLDGLEVFREAVRIGHLDHPIDAAPAMITSVPAALMRLDGAGKIEVGGPADLILFEGRTYTELLSRPERNRIVIRDGRRIDTALPDYRELDAIVGPPHA